MTVDALSLGSSLSLTPGDNDRNTAGSGESRLQRPDAHRGLQDSLPQLRPCSEGLTPLDDGTGCGTPSSGDILQRLKALQQVEETAVGGPQRHWGDAELRVRSAFEDFANAVESGREETCKAIEDALHEVDPRAIDSDSFALLHHAAMYGSIEGVALLVKRKANLNARTKVHETPLMLAAYYRHAEVVALLLAHKARADLADWQGRTPLAAAKVSRCGNGLDNHAQAQARCVGILSDRAVVDQAASSRREVEELREQGNAFFKKAQWHEAIAAYSIGLSFGDSESFYANRAACYLQLQKYMEAKLDSQKAVGLAGDAGHKKASWRLAKAALALGELDRADEAINDALKIHPGDVALRQLRNDVVLERRRRLGVTSA